MKKLINRHIIKELTEEVNALKHKHNLLLLEYRVIWTMWVLTIFLLIWKN